MKVLVDYQHPVVTETARRLIATKATDKPTAKLTDRAKVEAIFYFVRDEIKYMLLPGGDIVPASEIIAARQGQCNNKNVAFLALCQAAGIPARIHFGLIVKDILRGLVSDAVYRRIPETVSHSWMEVKLDDPNEPNEPHEKEWKRIDTHILDHAYFQSAKQTIHDLGWNMGYAVADTSVDDFILYDTLIPDTPIIPEEHGAYNTPEEYLNSPRYANKLNWFTALAYKLLMRTINRQLNAVRTNHSSTK